MERARTAKFMLGVLSPVTFVAVVFDAEFELLLLQARSFRVFVQEQLVGEIIVIDNTVFGLGGRRTRRLRQAYGAHAARVRVIRTRELAVDLSADGWRSQQAAKLLVARKISAEHYVVLDAKNHFVRRVARADFLDLSGTPHGGRHSYLGHPLHSSLIRTLASIGFTAEQIAHAERSFPVTATPFVMTSAAVRDAVTWLEQASRLSFADAFEERGLLEFFYYAGWMQLHRPQIPVVDGIPIQAPVVWGADPSRAAVEHACELVAEHDAPVFAVHRRALIRAKAPARTALIAFWTARDLLTETEARALVRRFRRNYRPAMFLTRSVERVRRWRISGLVTSPSTPTVVTPSNPSGSADAAASQRPI